MQDRLAQARSGNRRTMQRARPQSVTSRLAHAVVLSGGWRRRLIAWIAGASGALAMAPVDAFVALVVPLSVALWLIDGCAEAESGGALSGRSLARSMLAAADAGWWLGFGYFVAGLWWLGSAFLAEADRFAWALPFGVLGLPAYLALYTASGFALARLLWMPGPLRILVLAASLTAAEWLRGTLLTGFPWNEFGMALGGNLVLGQAASLVGVHGLTLLATAMAAAPAVLADAGGRPAARVGPPVAAAVLLAALAGYGAVRLAQPVPSDVAGVRLRVMQPNTTIDGDFSYANKDAIVRHYLDLSDRATSPDTPGLSGVTHLVWPESAFPFIVSRDAEALSTIGAALPQGTLLITGAARLERGPQDAAGRPVPLYYNAVQVIASGGSIVGSYDKVHLVPFGEFLPLEHWLTALGVTRFVDVPGGFQAGTGRRALTVPGLPPVAAIVCYEAIFSGEVVPREARAGPDRPGLLLNVTNDAWFGSTPGPSQHFAQARLRAIEEGLPLVRSASTGISAIVDPYGRVRAALPVGVENVIDGALPGALPPPFFARYGNTIPLCLVLLCFVGTLVLRGLPLRNVSR